MNKDKDKKNEFRQIYEEWADPIFRHCYARTSDREQAKDLAQETFVHFWNYLRGAEAVRSAKSLLYRIANNLVIDYYRKHKAVPMSSFAPEDQTIDPGHDPTEERYRQDDLKRALAAVEQLAAPYRQVITMRLVDNLSPAEIAAILQESENAVSIRLHRGLKKLRELLAQQNHD